jgi:hypothetical protein
MAGVGGRIRFITMPGETHPLDLAVELGCTAKKARGLAACFRPGMSDLARQVMINQTIREGKLPPLTKSIAELEGGPVMCMGKPVKVWRPRGNYVTKRCVSCECVARFEARRSKKAGWEPVCWAHGEQLEGDGRTRFRSLQGSTLQRFSLWNRRKYERNPEGERRRKREYYRANRDRILESIRLRKAVAA